MCRWSLDFGLAEEIWNEHYPSIIGQAQVDYMLERFQSARAIAEQIATGVVYYLLFHRGTPAGYVAFHAEQDSDRMFLSKLYIRKKYRSHGFGRVALRLVEAAAHQEGLHSVYLTVNRHNTTSIRIYEHMGFRKESEQVKDIGGGFVMDDYVMVKHL